MSLLSYQNEFKKLLDRKYFSSEIHPLRKDAFSKLEATGFPTKKWENWRFTNLSRLTEQNFSISEINDGPQSRVDISEYEIEDLLTIVIYNGHFQQNISSFPNGEPCDDAFPDLFGDPKPITVLQDIKVGFLDLDAFEMALEICFSL